ncbi:GGDEF domain-containing protein, partial [Pseudomonas aeruginosa]
LGIWALPGLGPQVLEKLGHGNLTNLEVPLRRRNGSTFSALLSAQHVALDQTPALVVVIRDITHLVETQELLRISEEKFANAFHAYPDGLLISRLEDGTLIDVN